MARKGIVIASLSTLMLHIGLWFSLENYRYGMSVPIPWPVLTLAGRFVRLNQVEDVVQARAVVVLITGSPVAIILGGM
jgi:hypothetical protein